MTAEDLDVCACGDYRRQHARHRGRCQVCTVHDAMNGGACHVFRLHLRASLTYSTVRR